MVEYAGILLPNEHKKLYFPCHAIYKFNPTLTGQYVVHISPICKNTVHSPNREFPLANCDHIVVTHDDEQIIYRDLDILHFHKNEHVLVEISVSNQPINLSLCFLA